MISSRALQIVPRSSAILASTMQYRGAAAQPAVADKAAERQDAKARKMERKFEESPSFGMNIFRGRLFLDQMLPYPEVLDEEGRETLSMILGPTEKFFENVNNAAQNDLNSEIPKEVLQQFAELGAFGAVVPAEYEGAGLNNTQMARLAEIVGANDLALGVTMGAHQSIGYKGIVLRGNDAQKAKYLPDLATGRKFAAFALTEPQSGSDANSIRTRAELSPDGKHYILNGNKIWISNGGFADVFTVFCQTPVTKDGVTKDKVSALIVERGFGGVSNGPPEKKMGIKGSNTVEVTFDNCKVPVENRLGEEGEGFKIAMHILNNGRFGIPAACTGSMRYCINKAIEHANNRTQFGNKLRDYGDIRRKISDMAMKHYVCESVVYMLAGNMDNGVLEYQIEAAIGKIVGSEYATQVCDESIQMLGGMGFMQETGLERVARDLRIFRIFEGTNDILRLFVALTGCQYAGAYLKQLMNNMKNPTANFGLVLGEASKRMARMAGMAQGDAAPNVDSKLAESASLLSKSVDAFGACVEEMLRKHGKGVLNEQQKLRRLADGAIDIYCMAATIARADRSIKHQAPSAAIETRMTNLICAQAVERININLKHIRSSELNKLMDEMDWLGEQVLDQGEPCQQHPLGM